MITNETRQTAPRYRIILRWCLYVFVFLTAFVGSAIALFWFFWDYPNWSYHTLQPKASIECQQVGIGMDRQAVLKVFEQSRFVPEYESEEKGDKDVLTFARSNGTCYVELDPTGGKVVDKRFESEPNKVLELNKLLERVR